MTEIISDTVLKNVLAQLASSQAFRPALETCLAHSKNRKKVYLVGGKLYRTIIEELYGYPARAECCDYDFVAEQTINIKGILSTPWDRISVKDSYNYTLPGEKLPTPDSHSMEFKAKGIKVDLISLGSLPHILKKDLPRSIESYFDSVPLDIQAIALELNIGKGCAELLGIKGQRAILRRKVAINNQETLDNYCAVKGIMQDSYIRKKAKSVRFDW